MTSQALLPPWIRPLVEDDLRVALVWKRNSDSSQSLQPEQESAYPKQGDDVVEEALSRGLNEEFDWDDSNLRIRKSHVSGRVLKAQIVRFVKTAPHVQAVISDGATSIYAKFTTQVTKYFKHKHNREFTREVEGCIVIIKGFEIVATSYGDPNQHLSLLVKAFNYLGLEQDPIGTPEPVHKYGAIANLLKELSGSGSAATYDSPPQKPQTQQDEQIPSPASVASQILPAQDTWFATQERFATQIPDLARREPSAPSRNFPSMAPVAPPRAPGHIMVGYRPYASTDADKQGNLLKILERGYISLENHSEASETTEKLTSVSREAAAGAEDMEIVDTADTILEVQADRESSKMVDASLDSSNLHQPWINAAKIKSDMLADIEQRNILSRLHSWYPAKPGLAFPAYNLPSILIQELRAAAENSMSDSEESDVEVDVDAQAGDEAGSTFSSEQWPPSSEPPRPESSLVLPPSMHSSPSSSPVNRQVRSKDPLPPDSSRPASSRSRISAAGLARLRSSDDSDLELSVPRPLDERNAPLRDTTHSSEFSNSNNGRARHRPYRGNFHDQRVRADTRTTQARLDVETSEQHEQVHSTIVPSTFDASVGRKHGREENDSPPKKRNRPYKKRFNFSQDSPITEDPQREQRVQRREYLSRHSGGLSAAQAVPYREASRPTFRNSTNHPVQASSNSPPNRINGPEPRSTYQSANVTVTPKISPTARTSGPFPVRARLATASSPSAHETQPDRDMPYGEGLSARAMPVDRGTSSARGTPATQSPGAATSADTRDMASKSGMSKASNGEASSLEGASKRPDEHAENTDIGVLNRELVGLKSMRDNKNVVHLDEHGIIGRSVNPFNWHL
ncbi:hypothetical protein NA57DRAFT_72045 [Rhizodiscina lignyota]|uniref:Shelterin complex subunit TPP1/Est3 domain-containing protein n=1 Tax=Rhizodiscina lignyota TaxID=1504668 RepID=A0A9P4MAB1_9PEZI|nr:hypothetical protein NA57DRAFT_72045 [Rhizodiscina lignyota]